MSLLDKDDEPDQEREEERKIASGKQLRTANVAHSQGLCAFNHSETV